MNLKRASSMLGLIALGFSGVALADEGPTPQGVPQLNHVFLIMMENHGYGQIVNNPNAPFINSLAQKANLAQKYFAVGHPSLTNYLEVVGGSNFGVQSDNDPDWHNSACKPNVVSGLTNTDNPTSPNICPIAGVGTDAATPVLDITNETQGLPGLINIDGALSFGPAPKTIGKTIGDQLVATNKSWKSYQESLPISGADGVNYSDGFFTDSTDFTKPSAVHASHERRLGRFVAQPSSRRESLWPARARLLRCADRNRRDARGTGCCLPQRALH